MLKQKKILITGGGGYIGNNLLRQLLKDKNLELIVVSSTFKQVPDKVTFIQRDILCSCTDVNLFKELGSPDIIIHLAWRFGFDHFSDTHLEDLPKHYNFLKNMINSGCKNLSIIGTMHEIGFYKGEVTENTPTNPLNIYGVAKDALRKLILTYCKNKSVSLKWLRVFYITGNEYENNSLFTKILKSNDKNKQYFPMTSGKKKFDFIDINDLVIMIAKASLQCEINGIINCCSGKPTLLKEKVDNFIKINNLSITPTYGTFMERDYESDEIWGNISKIKYILEGKV